MSKVFVSYRYVDRLKVEQYVKRLKADQINLWFDQEFISIGDDWKMLISKAIAESEIFLLFLTESMIDLKGSQTDDEMGLALKKAKIDSSYKVLPVRINPRVPVPRKFRKYAAVDLSRGHRKERNYQRLLKLLK